jgi:hypothetical protein
LGTFDSTIEAVRNYLQDKDDPDLFFETLSDLQSVRLELYLACGSLEMNGRVSRSLQRNPKTIWWEFDMNDIDELLKLGKRIRDVNNPQTI